MKHPILMLLALLSLTASAQSPATARSSDAALLAPTGTLRAAFLATNPVHGRVDPQTGAVTGPVADLVKEFAQKLGVPYKLIAAPNPVGVIEHLRDHTADIGFLAFEASRAQDVDFAGAFVLMHNTYIVRADSPMQKAADADRSGLQIGAVKGQAPEIFLSGNLKNARMKLFPAMPSQAELESLLQSGEVDAFGVNSQRALDAAAASPKLRALPDSFMSVEQYFVVEKGQPAKAVAIRQFVDEVRASGFIKASLERAKISGVDVAPAQKQ